MKIYTRFGDKGKTSLIGKVVDKDDLRVASIPKIQVTEESGRLILTGSEEEIQTALSVLRSNGLI